MSQNLVWQIATLTSQVQQRKKRIETLEAKYSPRTFHRIQNSVVPLCKGWEEIMIKSCWIERVDPMRTYLICPTCGSDDIVKNGLTRRAKQSHKCRDCGRQFVEDPQWQPIDRSTIDLIDLILLERILLAGIARVLSLSERSLQQYVNQLYEQVP